MSEEVEQKEGDEGRMDKVEVLKAGMKNEMEECRYFDVVLMLREG